MSEKTATESNPIVIAQEQREVLFRHFRVGRGQVDQADPTVVQLAASSEYPNPMGAKKIHVLLGIAKQEGEEITEILSHNPGDYDLTRFKDGHNGAFLDEHYDNRHLGHIRDAAVGPDKILRVAAKFDMKTKLSRTRHAQMLDESRPNVSLGYFYTKYLGPRAMEGGKIGHVFGWEALETSSVAVPADPTVGMGRKKDEWRCIRCGDMFARKNLNENFVCADCDAAETPEEGERTKPKMERSAEDWGKENLWAACGIITRKKKEGAVEEKHSHADIEMAVTQAAHGHKDLKHTDANGNKNSDFRVHDIHSIHGDDGVSYVAYIIGPSSGAPDYKREVLETPVEYDHETKTAKLGEMTPVERSNEWKPVERTLTADGRLIRGAEPYGDVEYADNGVQADKKKRYPINTKEHAKAAWSYINQKGNADKYTPEQLSHIKGKIKAALKKFGVETSDEGRSEDGRENRSAYGVCPHCGAEVTSRTRGGVLAKDTCANGHSYPSAHTLVRSKVDSKKFANGSAPTILLKPKNHMADEPKITPELIIDNLDNEHVRSAIAKKGYIFKIEVEAAAKTKTDKIAARNTEILSLEKEFCRDFGSRIAHRAIGDGKKEPLYLRDGIHIAAMEACAMDDSKSDSEVRQIFRSKVDDLKRDSVSEDLIQRAMNAAETGLAGRCGDMFEVTKRCLERAHKDGIRSTSLMPDGAEAEYTEERKRFYKNMPGTSRMADLGGFFVPETKGRKVDGRMARRADRRMTRDALASDFSTAGAMIAPEFRPYIELLRNKIVMSNLGATYIGGCTGEQVFPRQEAATIAQSLPEGNPLQPYDQQLGQIKMGPHRVGSRQYYSRLALIQAPPDFESMVWNDHSAVLALYQDEMAIIGSGAADQPVGILNQPGINQIIFGGTPTYQSILNFRTNIRKYNVDGPLAFTTTSVGQGRLAYLPAALNGSTVITQGELDALWKGDEIDGEMLGCKAIASQQIPGDILLAGVFQHLLIASWGGIFTIVDNYTRADRDEVAITFNTYFDIAVRHAQAFTRSMDSVNQ